VIGEQAIGRLPDVEISSVAHEGLGVTVDGRRAQFAIVGENGTIIAVGEQVAREAQAVAINSYRNFLQGNGHLRVRSAPINPQRLT
jgi:hypothetical protein